MISKHSTGYLRIRNGLITAFGTWFKG